jgi:hypothetical protein
LYLAFETARRLIPFLQYQGEKGWEPAKYPGLCEKILAKSQTVAGFFLVQYSQLWKQNLDKLFNLYALGKLKVMHPYRYFEFTCLHSVLFTKLFLH